MTKINFDHYVIAIDDWSRSNDFYARVLRAEVLAHGAGFVYRFGATQINIHSPESTEILMRGRPSSPAAQTFVSPGKDLWGRRSVISRRTVSTSNSARSPASEPAGKEQASISGTPRIAARAHLIRSPRVDASVAADSFRARHRR